MNVGTRLQFWHQGAWCEIGWPAYDLASQRALREHGVAMAASYPTNRYRIIVPNLLKDEEPTVVEVFPTLATV